MIYLRLFWEFFKTGLFSVGGGLATLPFIYDMSDRTGWFTYQQIADMVAVSESTPGPIGVNTATYVGYITGGVPGALIATLGLVTPAVICILIIASCLKKFRENRFVDHAFYGLRPASAALIAAAGFSVVRISLIQESAFQASGRFADLFFWKGLLLAAVIWVLTNVVKPTTANAPKRPKSCFSFSFITLPQRSGPPAKTAGGPGQMVSVQPRSVSANCA